MLKWNPINGTFDYIRSIAWLDGRFVNVTGDTMTGVLNISEIRGRDANGLKLYDDGGNGIFIKDGGNVGIGTTNPTNTLDVNGIIGAGYPNGAGEIRSYQNNTLYVSLKTDTTTHKSGIYRSNFGSFPFYFDTSSGNTVMDAIYSSFSDVFMINGTEKMRLNSSGNLGIGTTSPTQKLDVNGKIAINGQQTIYNAGAIDSTNYNGSLFIGNGGTNLSHSSGTEGYYNFGIGNNALYYVSTGSYNIGIGTNSLYKTSTGSYNSTIGNDSMYNNTTGSSNVAIGFSSLRLNLTGSNNVALGNSALYSNEAGSYSVAIGTDSQKYANDTTTPWTNANTSVGYQALRGSGTASANTGNYNTAIGYQTLYSNTSGERNFALGHQALYYNTTGSYNTALGVNALQNNVSGNYNIAIGYQSLRSNLTGAQNTALGMTAGYYDSTGVGITAPSHSLFLGYDTRALADGDTNEIVIGYNAIGNGSNSATLGNDSITKTILKGSVGIGTTNPQAKLTIASTSAYESAALGSELLSSSNWTLGTGWSGDFSSGFAHTAGTGNTATLTNTLAAVVNNYYQIAYTVTGRTAGSFTIAFGGESKSGISATGAWGPRATTTDSLVITPTDTFDGTIVLSIKVISTYSPTFALYDSTNASSFEIRNSLASLNNTFIGIGSGRRNTTGNYNSAQGVYSLLNNTTGNYNSAQGVNALLNNTTGNYNSAQGVYSLYSNTTGSYNSAQGVNALLNNTTGNYNSAQGVYSLYANTTGFQNSAQGYAALYANTTGNYNSAQGFSALYSNKTGSNGVAIGYESQRYANDTTTPWTNYNTSIGYQALRGSGTAANNTGNYNTAIGHQALLSNTTGYYNSAQGYAALYYNTTGYNNSAQGFSALYYNTTGYNNSAQGMQALLGNTTGYNNSAIGYQAGRYYNGTTGNLTSASNSLFLGASASALADGDTNEIVIGYNTIGKGSNTAVIGNADVTDVYLSSDIGATVHAGKFKLGALNTAPASASDTGTQGEIRFTADAIYFCIATDTWVKTTLASW